MTNLHAPGEGDQNSKNACWRTPVSCVVPPATSRCIIFEHSKNSPRTQGGTNRPGSARWPHGAGKPWSSVERVTRTPSDATYVKFANVICDAGKPYALKGACTVWRETDEKVPERATRQPSTLRLIPLNLDTNHGYAKTPVANSEVTKKREALQKRLENVRRWTVGARKRMHNASKLYRKRCQQTKERADTLYRILNEHQREMELEGVADFLLRKTIKEEKAVADAEIEEYQQRQWKAYHTSNKEFAKCEKYCREQREFLRAIEDLAQQEREMYELDVRPVQLKLAIEAGGERAGEKKVITAKQRGGGLPHPPGGRGKNKHPR